MSTKTWHHIRTNTIDSGIHWPSIRQAAIALRMAPSKDSPHLRQCVADRPALTSHVVGSGNSQTHYLKRPATSPCNSSFEIPTHVP